MATVAEQACYTLIRFPDDAEQQSEDSLRLELENSDPRRKAEALKKAIRLILNGERLPSILMTVIRFVMPNDDHELKKLLLIFWEVVPKTTADGKLLQEMILVCDAYRKDLQHPNEFIRGSTLRFLCKLKEPELLEPLMPSIRACLEHRHAYVRRNAVLAIYTIYKNFDQLIPDAPELVQNYLEGEQDASCKRNAFMMLIHVDQERALDYLSSCIDQLHSFNDILQLVIVELVYKVCHAVPSERARFIRCVYSLLSSNSAAVRYEAAGTLVMLSSTPTAVKAAAQCYIELILKESDNNVKLIVLDRLLAFRDTQAHKRVLQELVMDVLRVLVTPAIEVRRKTLDLVMELVTSRTVGEVVQVLRKEASKTHDTTGAEDTGKYRQLLVRSLHRCSIEFADVAPQTIPLLVEFLSDNDKLSAGDVLEFVREAVQRHDNLRPLALPKLLEVFSQIKDAQTHRAAMWVLGEFATDVNSIKSVMAELRRSLGELPLVDSELRKAGGDEKEEEGQAAPAATARKVTADGTYATQSAFSGLKSSSTDVKPPIRAYLLDGNFFIGSALAAMLAKLAIRYVRLVDDERKQNAFCGEAMLIMASVLHLGRSGLPKKAMMDDDADRIATCLRVLAERSAVVADVFHQESRQVLDNMLLVRHEEEEKHKVKKDEKDDQLQVDDPINFTQLTVREENTTAENRLEASLLAAVGESGKKADEAASSKLNKVHQLTGFSDPVYAEAYVSVNQFDIILDVLVVNQTADVLQGLTLELATLGDLKLMEKPQPCMLGPHDFTNIKANIKVASTENGIIFGNIVYDVGSSQADRCCVVLSNIHIDIMDYLSAASCTEQEFRQMWADFEWENKVFINTNIRDPHEYLQHLLSITNMRCLTPAKALVGQSTFLAANLYARSVFGEDALANLSVESTKPDAPVTGHIRIRTRSQGMALSLGDKVTLSQKKTVNSSA